MTLESLGVIIAFLTGLGAVIVSLRTSLNSVSQKELKALHDENDRLRAQIVKLEKRLEERDAKVHEREDRIDQLEKQLTDMEYQLRELKQENVVLREELEDYRKTRDTGELKKK